MITNRHRVSSFVITSNRAVDEWLSLIYHPLLVEGLSEVVPPISEWNRCHRCPGALYCIAGGVMTEWPMWMIRAERNGSVVRHFLNEGVAYLGWGIGPIHPTDSKENIRQRLHERYPREKPCAVPNIIGMLKRFSCQVQVGDHFVTYDPERRLYHIGTVDSDAEHRSTTWFDYDDVVGYVRQVNWVSTGDRDHLSKRARNCVGCQLSHFRLSDAVSEEIRRLL